METKTHARQRSEPDHQAHMRPSRHLGARVQDPGSSVQSTRARRTVGDRRAPDLARGKIAQRSATYSLLGRTASPTTPLRRRARHPTPAAGQPAPPPRPHSGGDRGLTATGDRTRASGAAAPRPRGPASP